MGTSATVRLIEGVRLIQVYCIVKEDGNVFHYSVKEPIINLGMCTKSLARSLLQRSKNNVLEPHNSICSHKETEARQKL